ncbi:proline rich transmembrane protein 1B-like [Hydra vulgaris]|uniref:Proline rich transmembrane protein 1B-like n=1 Tax=Hydra vulgaris TaxID=6087 RepID=A0ABM4DKY8_HYDVU
MEKERLPPYTAYPQNINYQPYVNPDSSNTQTVDRKVNYSVPNHATFVTIQQPGFVNQHLIYTGPLPESHTLLAWLTCIFCCCPLGLASIIKSNEVTQALGRGDVQTARIASESAKKFGHASLGCGIFINFLVLVILIIWFTVVVPSWRY